MPTVRRKLLEVCAAIVVGAPLCASAQGVVIGDGRVKTDSGEFVTSAGQSWACLGAEWHDEGTVPGKPGTRYSCAGTVLDSATYTAISVGRSAVALAELKAALDGVALNVARSAESTDALRRWIEDQLQRSSERLYETIAARFDAIPARALATQAARDELAKLREDVLAAVKANATQPPRGGPGEPSSRRGN
jgi:hypothetical protein